jgi:hypothetical protein
MTLARAFRGQVTASVLGVVGNKLEYTEADLSG